MLRQWYLKSFLGILFATPALAFSDCYKKYPTHEWISLQDPTEHFRGFRQLDFPHDYWLPSWDQVETIEVDKATQLVSTCEFQFFVLSFEWLVTEGGNGGIKYQIQEKLGAVSFEYQMVDPDSEEALSSPLHSSSALYDIIGPKKHSKEAKAGHWNHGLIIVRPNVTEHWLNGEKTLSYSIYDSQYLQGLSASKFRDRPQFRQMMPGRILLQNHGQKIFYRNLRLKRLPSTALVVIDHI